MLGRLMFGTMVDGALGPEDTTVWLDSKNRNFSVPVRVSFFAWEATWAKILTLDQLRRKGWRIPNRSYMYKEKKKWVIIFFIAQKHAICGN
ncbi:hypothetical protein CK203_075201 [Vitis vinifera]|uniref:Reverse transcriptase zinc-binding domain-containing protein n=1 Tax=Vitis vinifera TaxID=29760 RepID=A0A438F641_VITVI|nr:hypothetical protein CK203_075201 [Vitis vinifera]